MKKETIEKFLSEVEHEGRIGIHFEQGSALNPQTLRAETGNRTSGGYIEGKYIGFRKEGDKFSLRVIHPIGARYVISQEHIAKIDKIGVVRSYSD